MVPMNNISIFMFTQSKEKKIMVCLVFSPLQIFTVICYFFFQNNYFIFVINKLICNLKCSNIQIFLDTEENDKKVEQQKLSLPQKPWT